MLPLARRYRGFETLRRACRSPAHRFLAAAIATALSPEIAVACDREVAVIKAASGSVDIRRAGSQDWRPASVGEVLCTDDALRTGNNGGVALRTVDENTERLGPIGFIQFPASEPENVVLRLLSGLLLVVSHDARQLKIQTPSTNGAPRGTEFEVGVAGQSVFFAVLHGEVDITSGGAEQRVAAGQRLNASSSGPEAPVADNNTLLRWAHYPRVIDGRLPATDDAEPAQPDADFFVRRAARWLEHGNVANSLADLERARALDPMDARADAVQAMIALEARDRPAAMALVESALRKDDRSTAAWLASSFVKQSAGNGRDAHVAAAVADIKEVVARTPGSGLAWARLAELYLGSDNYPAAAEAATEAVRLAPDLAYALTVQGFAFYNSNRNDEARAAFARAIELESMAPTPWFGLALVHYRTQNDVEARRAADMAVLLDPTDGGARAGLAKFYDAQSRPAVSREQLALGKQLEPDNPTPLMVESFHSQSTGNPIEALLAVRDAQALNAGVPLTRSRLSVDSDSATMTAGRGSIYLEANAPRLGARDARRIRAANPTDPAGPQLAADIASQMRFGAQSTVSDSYYARLLSSLYATPANAQRELTPSALLRRVTPRDFVTNDLDTQLARDGMELSASTVIGSHDTRGASVAMSVVNGGGSLNFAAFRAEGDGWGANSDRDDRGISVRAKHSRDPGNSVMFDLSSTATETGDVNRGFFSDVFGPTLRMAEDADSLRVGWRHDVFGLNRAHPEWAGTVSMLGTVAEVDSRFSTELERYNTFDEAESIGVRLSLRGPPGRLDLGFTVSANDGIETTPSVTSAPLRLDRRAAYAYLDAPIFGSLTLSAGLNADVSHWRGVRDSEVNGKLGLTWEPSNRTTVRVAVFESPPGSGVSSSRNNVQPNLEPTYFAGFPQYYFPDSDRTRIAAFAVDHELDGNLFVGLDARRRSMQRPISGNGALRFDVIDEEVTTLHGNWFPTGRLGLAAAFTADAYDAPPFSGPFVDFKTRTLELEADWFLGGGWTVGLSAARVSQKGTFQIQTEAALPYGPGQDTFSLLDASLRYRLNNRAHIELRVHNLADQTFNYQEPEIDRVTYVRERSVFLNIMIGLR